METITLNNGVEMPRLGLGVFQMNDEQVLETLPKALDAGYRLIDTASRYYNEEAVGRAIAESGVPRDELFVTTKLWFKDHGYENTKDALQVSLDKLGLDRLDLWLIHQPFNDYYGAWRAMEDLLDEGLVRAIGVSNFYPDRYADLVAHNRVVPAVNQRETHVFNQQKDMAELARRHGTVLQAWAPLAQGDPEAHGHPVLAEIATAHGKSVAQVMLRRLIQRDIAVAVKSTHENRLRENIDVFDFSLTDDEMARIAELDRQQPVAGFTHRDPRMLEMLRGLE
ncbi:aldo/keto reductase [Saccharopolyspora sp. 6T]|uniref:aldo/keto reductase n=1 Tax=Saccharopolyspora sp. 6T TaxID=2877238 RepID=UPI001CD6C928|nr:aldo/keto reductase [Saccharopolyspora sp. 6T]MCA1188492.1 aldo/keto reductase [Saccharopolyspora sp. 6T]